MRELVVISGKGGTGKTSVMASFAVLSGNGVLVDCDVDAADLHLLLSPEVMERHDFRSGHEAVIRTDTCNGCGLCEAHCRYDAIHEEPPGVFRVVPYSCEGCGVCVRVCPENAIDFPESLCGEWMVSGTRCGPMVHARLGVAAENSGKLVSTIRHEARRIAEEGGIDTILVDGPPGIGCPVIASLTGASQVLVVTEPTLSGEHDLHRVLTLADHFGIAAAVCVNKWNLNPEMADRIEEKARGLGARVIGRIRYDRAVTLAQIEKKTIVEIESAGGEDVRRVWEALVRVDEGP